MQRLRIASMLAWMTVLALVSTAHAEGPPAPGDLVKASLVAETASIAPGMTLWVDLRLEIKPGWHTYWRNPGDAGLPTTIDWSLPPGFSAGPIHWPVPRHFVQGDAGSYGYTGSADLLVTIAVPADPAPERETTLTAAASWLVCAEICIPGGAELSLTLPVAARPPGPDPAAAARFAAARAQLPLPAPFATRFAAGPHDYRLSVPASAVAGLRDPAGTFFPFGDSLIDNAAESRVSRRAGGLDIVLTRAAPAAAMPKTLDGVLVLRGAEGDQRAFEISASPAPAAPVEKGLAWWQALLLALLGGVVLNAMPCVFPILSLKLLGLARQAHGDRSEQISHGLAYTAGVLVSFAALGGLLLAARAGGQAVGWGFQLQSPIFVALIAYILFAMGLSLSGVVAFGGGGAAGIGGRLAARPGLAGTFFTGVLATVVATPCTAPFMGAALGFALIAPAAVALGIFLALGLGLAAPYLLASLAPGWQRILPKPGAWMDLVKQLLAFPLYATVAWLLWVLIQEIGPGQSLAALLGLVLVGFALWIYGRTRPAAPLGRRLGTGLAAAGTAAAILLAASFTTVAGTTVADGAVPANAATPGGLPYLPFTRERLSALEAAGKPVFVNLTASWCVTCLINERVALDSEAVREAFAARGIVALKGDWTSRNPEITGFLQQFGRSGVPLYLFYDGTDEPVILPQILTTAGVLDAIGKS